MIKREEIKEQLLEAGVDAWIFNNPIFLIFAEKYINLGYVFSFNYGKLFLIRDDELYVNSGYRAFTQIGFRFLYSEVEGTRKKYFVIEEIFESRRAHMKRLVENTFPFYKTLRGKISYYNEAGVLEYKEEIGIFGRTKTQGKSKNFEAYLEPFTPFEDFFKLNHYNEQGTLVHNKIIKNLTSKKTFQRIKGDTIEVKFYDKFEYITTRYMSTGKDLNNFEYNEIPPRSFKEIVLSDKYLKNLYDSETSSLDLLKMPIEERIIYNDLILRFGGES